MMTREQTITIEGVEVVCIDDGDGWCVDNPTLAHVRRLIWDGKLEVEGFDKIVNPAQYGLPE